MNGAKTLQIYVHCEALIGYKVAMACFEIWVLVLDVLGRNYTSYDFTLLHRLKNSFDHRINHFIATHQVFFTNKLLEDHLSSIFCLLIHLQVKVKLVVFARPIVTVSTLVNSFQ